MFEDIDTSELRMWSDLRPHEITNNKKGEICTSIVPLFIKAARHTTLYKIIIMTLNLIHMNYKTVFSSWKRGTHIA